VVGAESFATAADGARVYVRATEPRVPGELTAILSDGIACDGFIYKYLWDDLARLVRVAHWNYRGHGRSESPRDPQRLDVPSHAADLDAVRRHLGDPPVVLIGHSLGTQVCLEAYRTRAEGIAAMVLLSGSFGRVTHTFKGTDLLANVLPNLIEFTKRHPKVASGLWSRLPPAAAIKAAELLGDVNLAALRPDDLRPYFVHASQLDLEMFLRMLSAAGEHSAEDLLPQVDVPVLVVSGNRDSFTPPYVVEALAAALPKSKLEMVQNGTHVLPLEEPKLVADSIEHFLREHGPKIGKGVKMS
jgi:pimeloyl-ACP methyl ester carboxylesterase